MQKNNAKNPSKCMESPKTCGCNEKSHKTIDDLKKEETDESCRYQEILRNTCIEDGNKCDTGSSCSGCGCEENLLEEKEQLWDRKPLIFISASSIILTMALYTDLFIVQSMITVFLFLTVVVISGYEIIINGFKSLLNGHFTMNFLMTIAVFGSFLIGSGAEGALVIFLFYIALYLENYAGEKARKSISSLIQLVPETATVKKDSKIFTIPLQDVDVGDILVVKPGDKIPLDGTIITGFSSINQSTITGESIPVNKKLGDGIFAGTLNEEGYLEMKVTKRSDETVLSKIIKLVKESQKQRSQTENLIDKLAKYYTPVVIILAAVVAIIPVLVLGLSLEVWVYRALVLLIISCPCAFLLSTPVAMVSGITASAKNGVLIKGSRYVEEIEHIKVALFDKTGTLTEGKLEVTDIINLKKYSKNEILTVAGSLESKSKHPIAIAITNYVEESDIKIKDVTNFVSVTGNGLMGNINEKNYFVGKKSFIKEKNNFPEDLTHELENHGKTVVLIANEKYIMGIIGLKDKIREKSKNTILKLKNKGIKTVMLTGDNIITAKTVTEDIGMDEYYAELLPEDKLRLVEDYLNNNISVAMVGDGINDAPSLARSNVGIAMGAAGSDVAIETADIALMDDDISKIDYLINISRKTMWIVKQNISIAIIVQLFLSVLAIFGFVSLWMAVTLGDMGLTLAVILNSLRIANTK